MVQKQLRKIAVQQRNGHDCRIAFGVVGKVIDYLIGFDCIFDPNGFAQFKIIKVFADADVFFDVGWIDAGFFRKNQNKLVQFIADFTQIGSQKLDQHLSGFGFHLVIFSVQYPSNPISHLVLVQFLALKDKATFGNGFVQFLTLV